MYVFADLLAFHAELEDLFFEHQCRLLRSDFPGALRLLETYEVDLVEHMRDEEEILIPVYVERCKPETGGDSQLFINEHQKMRWMVEAFKVLVSDLIVDNTQERKLIHLLEREAFYKRLCTHHDKRERDFLYFGLDRITTPQERSDILKQTALALKTRQYPGIQAGETQWIQTNL